MDTFNRHMQLSHPGAQCAFSVGRRSALSPLLAHLWQALEVQIFNAQLPLQAGLQGRCRVRYRRTGELLKLPAKPRQLETRIQRFTLQIGVE